MTPFEIVVAVDEQMGIGKAGRLPWRLSGDMAHFRILTTETESSEKRNAVVMGRVTWDSIPPRFRPLRRRMNLVVTRNPGLEVDHGVVLAGSLPDALEQAAASTAVERIFLIGGGSLYREAVHMPDCCRIHITQIASTFDCDTFFPELGDDFELTSRSETLSENNLEYHFEVYERCD